MFVAAIAASFYLVCHAGSTWIFARVPVRGGWAFRVVAMASAPDLGTAEDTLESQGPSASASASSTCPGGCGQGRSRSAKKSEAKRGT